MSSGLGTSGIDNWCSAPGSCSWNEAAQKKIGLPVLDRGHAPHREAAAVAGAVDVVDDRMLDIAGAQEIGVQRMRRTRHRQRRLRRRQRLPEHLAAEHVLGADVAALAAEQVVLETFQRQQFDQFGDDGGGHALASSGRQRIITRRSSPLSAAPQAFQAPAAAAITFVPWKQRSRIALAHDLPRGIVDRRYRAGIQILVSGDEAQRRQLRLQSQRAARPARRSAPRDTARPSPGAANRASRDNGPC